MQMQEVQFEEPARSTTDTRSAIQKAQSAEKRALWALVGANFFIETNRMEPFVAVYLISFKDWPELWVAYVSVVMNLVMLILQTPVGDYLDYSTFDRPLTAAATAIAAVTTMAVAWTSQLWAVILLKAIEGAASTLFLPGLMSLLLGVVPNTHVPKAVALTETSNKIGSVLFTIGVGLIGYYLYPDVSPVFYLLGGGGFAAACIVLLIPESSINHQSSCGMSERNAAMLIQEYHSKRGLAKQHVTGSRWGRFCTRYADLLKNKQIAMFALLTFLYHLANAGVVPLVAQISSIQDERTAITFTSAVLCIFYFVQGPTAWAVGKCYLRVGYKRILLLGHIVLPIRCLILGLLSIYYPNQYALAATQVFDGIGAGIYDTVLPLVVKDLTKGTGRFGITFGFVITCWRLGHGFSFLLAEGIYTAAHHNNLSKEHSYAVAFFSLGGVGLLVTLLLAFFMHLPMATAEEAESGWRTDLSGNGDIKRAFAKFDVNNDGTISRDEFLAIMTMAGEGCTPITEEEANTLFDTIDADGNGTIAYNEFEQQYNGVLLFKQMGRALSLRSFSSGQRKSAARASVL